MTSPRRREALTDLLGFACIVLVFLDYLRPALLFLPTVTAGGDTPCHYPTAVWFAERLLPEGRLHGWYPGAYLGHPLLLYYFPLPFALMAALAKVFGMPVAFKLGTVLGVFLLPVWSYVAFRLMGFRFPGPLLAAGASAVFLFLEENPIWGGTIASTLTGEFAYTYGIGLAVLYLGIVYRAYAAGRSPLGPALALGLVAFAHGYAVLWAGLTSAFFLAGSRRPARTLSWLLGVAGLAFALAAVCLLPLLSDWGLTTPYNDPWITVTTTGLVPPFLRPLFVVAGIGLAVAVARGRRAGGVDRRLLFLLHAAVVGAGLAAAGPALGVIDIRFVPFAQLALCLLAAALLGLFLERAARPEPAAVALVLAGLLYGDASSRVLRHWIDWNYTGLEAKELWPAYRRLAETLRATPADPRVAVEYSSIHERAGSIRMYETIPHFSGRSTLEGVYNQASLQTHPVYYLASELNAIPPNPFREIEYSTFDTEAALDHLRLFNVSHVVSLSPQLTSALGERTDVSFDASIPPYTVYRVDGGSGRYVEPLRYQPVRSSPAGWRDKAMRWFTRRPLSGAHLVFTEDPRIQTTETDEWLPAPLVPLPEGVVVTEAVGPEAITLTTSRPGHPLLVRVSYHPRWRAEGADGPFLTSPALMTIIPRERAVRLVYARNWADHLGTALTLGVLAFAAALAVKRRLRRPASASAAPVPVPAPAALSWLDKVGALPEPPRRWGAAVPALLIAGLVAARFVSGEDDPSPEATALWEKASKAFSEERYADAAEYARHGVARSAATPPLREELLCLRGESLLRAGQPKHAVAVFETLLRESPESPYVPQALFSGALAREAAGDREGAESDRERLVREHAETPWAKRLTSE
jgi:hypothetical protein